VKILESYEFNVGEAKIHLMQVYCKKHLLIFVPDDHLAQNEQIWHEVVLRI